MRSRRAFSIAFAVVLSSSAVLFAAWFPAPLFTATTIIMLLLLAATTASRRYRARFVVSRQYANFMMFTCSCCWLFSSLVVGVIILLCYRTEGQGYAMFIQDAEHPAHLLNSSLSLLSKIVYRPDEVMQIDFCDSLAKNTTLSIWEETFKSQIFMETSADDVCENDFFCALYLSTWQVS